MSIRPVDESLLNQAKKLATSPAKTVTVGADFQEKLAQSVTRANETLSLEDKAVKVAELLRLDMMRTTLAMESDAPVPASGAMNAPLMKLLAAFAEQAPAEPAAGESQGAVADTGVTIPPAPAPGSGNALMTSGGNWLEGLAHKASKKYGVDVGLIKAVIKAESNFNPTAVSRAGAQGLMQLMPATARGLGVTDSFDPEQNVMAGTRFLKSMLDRYDGNVDKALAAYNWGPGNVDKGGRRLPAETREYLVKVKGYYADFAA